MYINLIRHRPGVMCKFDGAYIYHIRIIHTHIYIYIFICIYLYTYRFDHEPFQSSLKPATWTLNAHAKKALATSMTDITPDQFF